MHCPCPHCGQSVIQDANAAGRVVTCPKCRSDFRMPRWSRGVQRAPWIWMSGALFLACVFMFSQDFSRLTGGRSYTASPPNTEKARRGGDAARAEATWGHASRQATPSADLANVSDDCTPLVAQPPTPRPFPGGTTDTERAVASVVRGDKLYRAGQFRQARDAFQEAVNSDWGNPFYHYLLALSQYQTRDLEAATGSVHRGVALERSRPVKNWGKRLMRYQGRSRVWLEQQRSKRRSHRRANRPP